MILQLSSLARSRDKFQKLHLHLQKTYGHQTKQGNDLPERFVPLKLSDPLTIWSNARPLDKSYISQYWEPLNLAVYSLRQEGLEWKRQSRHQLLAVLWDWDHYLPYNPEVINFIRAELKVNGLDINSLILSIDYLYLWNQTAKVGQLSSTWSAIR